MVITITRERPQDEHASLHQAAASQPGKPIRLRVQPQIYFALKDTTYRRGAFYAWRHVYWNLTCATVEDAIRFKTVLDRLFVGLERYDISAVEQALDKLDETSVKSAPSHTATTAT